MHVDLFPDSMTCSVNLVMVVMVVVVVIIMMSMTMVISRFVINNKLYKLFRVTGDLHSWSRTHAFAFKMLARVSFHGGPIEPIK